MSRCVCRWVSRTVLPLWRRCPNPEACEHEAERLEEHHSYTVKSVTSPPAWLDYTQRLCSASKGYQGVLCGTCLPGYGATGPFKCKKCYHADPTATPPKPPSVGGISGLYVFYWVWLALWYIFTVWTAKPDNAKEGDELHPPKAGLLDIVKVRASCSVLTGCARLPYEPSLAVRQGPGPVKQ